MFHCLNCSHASGEAFRFCPECGTEASAPSGTGSLIGKVLGGKYRIVNQVGSGAMGTVYRAEQVSLKKPIAIKVLHRDLTVNDESVRRFQAEGIAAGKFSHPNAIQIFDFDQDGDGNWFLAMEFVDGRSLRDYIAEKGALSADGAVHIITQVLEAVAEAHRNGIVHRDLKPDNIMVVGTGSGELLVKVLDFGLSKLVHTPAGSSLMTQTGRILGTPRYMAPEQWQGMDVDHRIDIYAAGLVLHEMLTGESPVSGSTIQDAMVQSTSTEVPSLLSPQFEIEVPEGLAEVVSRALHKNRDERYPDAPSMIADLDAIDFATRARRTRPARSTSRTRRRPAAATRSGPQRRVRIAVAAVAVIAIGTVIAFQTSGGEPTTYPRVSMKPDAERTDAEKRYVAALSATRDALREGRLADAVTAVERAKAMECVDAEAFYLRALVLRAKHDHRTAKLDCQDAIARDASFAEAIAELGWIHLDLGEWSEADTWFVKATGVDAGLASAVVGRARVEMERGSADDAREILSAVDATGAPAAVQARIGDVYLGIGALEEAAAAFTAAKRTNPFDWRAHAGLGVTMLRMDRPDEARPALTEALQLNPDAAGARTALATMHLDAEQWSQALEVITAGLARQTDNGHLQILEGVALHESGRTAEAIAALRKGTSQNPRDHRAWTLLGILLQQGGSHEDAIACYRQAEDIDRSRAQPFLNHGLCLVALQRYPEAEPFLERAMKLDQNDTFALLAYGVLAMDYLGKPEAALQAFRRYVQLGGEDQRVPEWIRRLGG